MIGFCSDKSGFVVTNSKLSAGKGVKVCNGRGEVENQIKDGKNTLRRDKTSCHRLAANQVRLLIGVLAYDLLHIFRQFYLADEEVKRSMEWLIKRLQKLERKSCITVGDGKFMCVGIFFGWTLPRDVRVRADRILVDARKGSEVRLSTRNIRLFHQRVDILLL